MFSSPQRISSRFVKTSFTLSGGTLPFKNFSKSYFFFDIQQKDFNGVIKTELNESIGTLCASENRGEHGIFGLATSGEKHQPTEERVPLRY